MNKKASVFGESGLWVVGLIVAVVLILLLWPFGKSAYSSITGQSDEASKNSLNYLFEEIDELANGEEGLIPYYIREGYVLVSGAGSCPENSLCICKDKECTKFLKGGVKSHHYFTFSVTPVVGTKERDVKNVRIERTGDTIKIRDTYIAET